MKKLTLSLASAVALSSMAFAGGDIVEPMPTPEVVTPAPVETSALELSANVTLASKYVWRGQDQNNNNPAIQGGFDASYKGFYLGIWASNIATGTDASTIEVDLYGGYAFELAGIGIDLGYIVYATPGTTTEWDDATKEAYVGVSKELGNFGLGAKLYYDFDTNNEDGDEGYYTAELSASYKLPYDIALAGTFGMDNMAGHVDDYYYSIGASKEFGKFEVGVTYNGYYADAVDDTTDNIVGYVSASF
ncbi:MAG: TorF family putative porin [Campylobacterota bacterium]|nr:TorF family putative porin [Campylobacterota bacterium]